MTTAPRWMFGWTTHTAALAATAVLLALSFPLPGWGFLAWVALAPAGWLAATSRRPGRLVITATVVFALWWVWMLRWLWPVTLPGALATAVFQALFWVAALWGTNRVVRRKRWPIAVVLPVVWVAFEWLRGAFPFGGFGWFFVGHTQGAWRVDSLGIGVQFAESFGSAGVSVLVVGLSGAIAGVATGLPRKPHFANALVVIGILIAAGIHLAVIGEDAARYTPPMRDRYGIPIAVVQTNAPHSNKLAPTIAGYEQDFALLTELHAEAVGESPALIVWPETVIPGKFNDVAAALWRKGAMELSDDDPRAAYYRALTAMPFRARELIAEHGVPAVVGSSTELPTELRDRPLDHNSAFLVDGNGQVVARYDKMHRVPFGEYIPGPAWLKDLVLKYFSPYDFDYSLDPGRAVTVFELEVDGDRTLRFATPICFEDTVGRLCRRMVYGGETGGKRIDALVNLTTDGWFGRLPEWGDDGTATSGGLGWRSMRLQHLQIASLRAIENRVPVVRSVNTGVSAIIDPTGRVVAAAEPGEATVLHGRVVLDQRRTLYGIVGDVPIMVLSAGAAVLLGWAVFTKPSRPRRRRR